MKQGLWSRISVAGLFLILGILIPVLNGQSDRGTITGTVTDQSGAVIVGASITATHVGTNVSSKATSGSNGGYTIPLLRVGIYQVTVEQASFKKFVQTGINVEVGQTHRVDISMALGQVTETVEVNADALQIESSNSDRGTVVTAQQVLDLPLVSSGERRNPAFFMTLAPGVTGRGTVMAQTSTLQGQRNATTTVNGSQASGNEFYLEGSLIVSGGPMSGNFDNLPFPPDVVGEFKIMTLLPTAEYGRTSQGITTFNLKSGGNAFHGTVWEYFRNDALDARGFFAPTRAINKQNEYGATFGGPIRKDKTFVYGWYMGFNIRKAGNNATSTVPTPAMRNGDLSNILGGQIATDALGRPVYASELYDPATTRVVPAGAVDPGTGLTNTSGASAILRDGFGFNPVTGLPIAGQANIIPTSRFDPVAVAMYKQFPDPNRPGLAFGYQQNWTTTITTRPNVYNWGVKIDQVFTPNQRVYGEYMYGNNNSSTSGVLPGALSNGYISTVTLPLLRLVDDWNLRSNLINHAVFGFNRFAVSFFPESGLGWPAVIGYKGVPQTGYGSTFPGSGGSQGVDASNNFTFDEGLVWIKGRHTVKGGFEYIKQQQNAFDSGRQSSNLSFASGPTALPLPGSLYSNNCIPGGACTGDGAASFLLGLVDNGTASVNVASSATRTGYYAGYVQDDFRASSKLTLNYGFRYDLFLPTVDAHNSMSWMDPNAINPALGGTVKGAVVFASDSQRAPTQHYNAYGPRFGLAYSLNDKTVLRGGYGILYTAGGGNRSYGLTFLQGYNSTNVVSTDNSFGYSGLFSGIVAGQTGYHMVLKDGWPSQFYALPPFKSPSYLLGGGPFMSQGTGHAPQIQNWTLCIQRQLPWQILLDVAYVGTKGAYLPSRLAPTSQMDSKYLSYQDQLFKNIANPEIQGLSIVQAMPIDPATGMHSPFPGFENLWGGNATLGQSLRRFPQYTLDSVLGFAQMRDFFETEGMSTYNSLQVQARKRLSAGLTFLVSYTWSKTLTNAESVFTEFSGTFVQDPYDRKLEKALSLNDYPNNLVASFLYELPLGPGKKWVNHGGAAGKVIGGWQIAGVVQYTSGPPQMVITGNNPLFPFAGPNGFITRPNVVPDVNKRSAAYLNGTWDPNAPGAAGSVLNLAAWEAPAPFTFGNAPRTDGSIRRFPFYNEDISIIKVTNINDRVSVQFRCDFLNVFNRTVFSFDAGGDQYGSIIQGNSINSGLAGFGHIGSQGNTPREIQFGLRINY